MSDLAATITAVRTDGRQRMARCPGHDDSTPSLAVGLGKKGGVLLHCKAGCETEAVLAAAGLTWADVAPPEPQVRTIAATYDYTDEHGGLLYQVVRYSPKDFRQRRPDGHGGWTWKLGNARRVLFGLPTLAGQTTVYIPEGEHDVLRLRAIGLAATCNAGGAGKWRDDYAQQLVGAGCQAVVVLLDNDTPGRAHADAIARSCHAVGLTVRVLELPNLPNKGDVSDWLGAGHTLGELRSLAGAALIWSPTPAQVLPVRTPAEIATLTLERPTAYAPFTFANAVLLFTGYAKRGKTSFLLYLIGCIVHGVECLDLPTTETGVVYLTEERPSSMRVALGRAGLLAAPKLHLVFRWDVPGEMTWTQIVEAAIATCASTDSKVLVIDTFPAWAGLRGDAENSSGAVTEALEPVQRGAKHDIAVVIVQHDRKGGGAVGESGRGSSAFSGAVDTILSLRRPEGNTNPNQRLLEAVSRFDGVPEALVIERASEDSFSHIPTGSRFGKNLYRALGDPGAVEVRKTEQAVLAVLKTGATDMDALKKALPEHKPTTINRALDELRQTSAVTRTGLGKKGSPYTYSLGPDVSFQTSNPRVREEKNPSEVGDGIGY